MFEFKFPDPGEGIQEGEIVKWMKKEGDPVKEDEVVGQIETDKAVVDIPSPKAGTILKINFKEGEKAKVGDVLFVIGEVGEKNESSGEKVADGGKVGSAEESMASPGKEVSGAEKEAAGLSERTIGKKGRGGAVVGELEEAPDVEVEEKVHSEVTKGIQQSQKILAAPAVRKRASDMGIDLFKVEGSGEGGKIMMSDLGKKEEKAEVPQQKLIIKKKFDSFGYLERIPLKGIRKVIAEHMVRSVREAPQVTSMDDIDVSKLWRIRKKEKVRLDKEGVKLTFLPFVVKALIAALKENPILNSSIEGDEIIIKKYFNIGIATETEVGLMVPVVKIAESKNIIQLAKEIDSLASKARARKIDLMDLKGGTFTITNYGSVGGNYGVPIINYPEAAILGLGRIFDRAVFDGKTVKNVKILPVSLTFDHRILDGGQAARFLKSLKMFLEDPDHLMLELK